MSEPEKLVRLVYQRDGKDYTFTGHFVSPTSYENFHKKSFEEVMTLASKVLIERPGHRLLAQRVEAPYPMTLPENIEHLLRTDLPKALEALSIGPQRVVVGVPRQVNLGGLRHGLDTLADALGEKVYIRYRYSGISTMQVEDPVTGRWMLVEASPDRTSLRCGSLPLERQTISEGHSWCTANIEDILGLQKPRYYLPRGWNPSEGWITHEDLQNMFETYKQEKDHAARS